VTSKLLVAGVLALDDLKTPYKSEKGIVGGAGIYSSISSSIFTETALVAAIGNDFPKSIIEKIGMHKINMQSVKSLNYPTFHWSGEYTGDMSQAITHETDFQINEHYDWEISSEQKESKLLLLCNNDPNIQSKVLKQVNSDLIAMDTMNLWIDIAREKLEEVVKQVDLLFINDAEALLYSGENNLEKAGEKLLSEGPKYVIIKRGENGSSLYSSKITKHLPAFKVSKFVDPTGAGDSFAGAAMGYLSRVNEINEDNLIVAMNYGSAVASITVEGFGTESIMNVKKEEVEKRFSILSGGPGRI
jgi:sugar/nucleoside kinase (ribokinase family)|tara:strand:- start:18 stop:923 length:906 start_codon:yes stop_codon:yes gene_type:complete